MAQDPKESARIRLLCDAHDIMNRLRFEQMHRWDEELEAKVKDVQRRLTVAAGLEPCDHRRTKELGAMASGKWAKRCLDCGEIVYRETMDGAPAPTTQNPAP